MWPRHPVGAAPKPVPLALTLLRATGMLSRLGMSLRPLPAGPMNVLEGPQMLGPVDVSYALAVGDVDPYELADDVLVPLQVTSSFRWRRPVRPGLRVDRRRRRGVVASDGTPVRSRSGCSIRPMTRRRSCFRDGPDGWSICGAGRCLPSRARSPYAPTGSLPPASTEAEPPVLWTTDSPRSRSSSSSFNTSPRRSQRMVRRRSAPGSVPARMSFHIWIRPRSFNVRVRRGAYRCRRHPRVRGPP